MSRDYSIWDFPTYTVFGGHFEEVPNGGLHMELVGWLVRNVTWFVPIHSFESNPLDWSISSLVMNYSRWYKTVYVRESCMSYHDALKKSEKGYQVKKIIDPILISTSIEIDIGLWVKQFHDIVNIWVMCEFQITVVMKESWWQLWTYACTTHTCMLIMSTQK
jgi:hypothetical protein